MAKLIGSAPNQISTNADLGSMAFEDRKNYATTSSSIHQPYRNIIINGDMSIAQRGTSVTGINSFDYHTLDRWKFGSNGSGAFTMSQSTDVPSGQGFASSLKVACTTSKGSLSAGDNGQIFQIFEGQNLQYLKKGTSKAESTTLSFWIKSNKTGIYIAELFDEDNNRQISQAYTINTADTWEKKILVYPGDASGVLDNDNLNSLSLKFWIFAGTTFSSASSLSQTWTSNSSSSRAVGQVNFANSNANELYLTGVQLEAGTTASDFEFLPFDVNLQRCQRYCLKYGGTNIFDPLAIGIAGSTTELYTFLDFRTQMRATPSVTSSTLQTNDFSTQQSVTALVTIANQTNNSMGYVKATVASGLTQFRPHFLQSANSTSAYLIFSAEL